MEEIFKDIEGYEGYYQISNLGRVKSLGKGNSNNSKEKILILGKDGGGYAKTTLYKDGKQKIFKVHRLVAKAFIPNPNNLPCVNHRDENKNNNCVDNLEWCTIEYNNNYGTRKARIAEKESKQVIQLSLDGKTEIAKFPSTNEVQRQLGFLQSHVSQCCNGKRKTSYGFRWEYA